MATIEAAVPIDLLPPRIATQPRLSALSQVRSKIQESLSGRRTVQEARRSSRETLRAYYESLVPDGASATVRKKAGILLRASETMDRINGSRVVRRLVVNTLFKSGVNVEGISRRALSGKEDDIEIHEDYIMGRPRREQVEVIISTLGPFLQLFRREILDCERTRLRRSNPRPQVQSSPVLSSQRAAPPIAAA